MSCNNGETWGTPFHFALHFLLRDKVPLHDGREGGIELGGQGLGAHFSGRVSIREWQEMALHGAV